MSEKQEKRRRYNIKLDEIAAFSKWLAEEPPMWRIVRWCKWKKARPAWMKEKKA